MKVVIGQLAKPAREIVGNQRRNAIGLNRKATGFEVRGYRTKQFINRRRIRNKELLQPRYSHKEDPLNYSRLRNLTSFMMTR